MALRDAVVIRPAANVCGGRNVEGDQTMTQRDQTFVPLTRRETIERTAAACAVVVMVFLALLAIQPA